MAANNEEKISSYIDLASVGKETEAFKKQLADIYDMFKKINATKITIEQSKTFEQTAAAVRKLKTEEDELEKISAQITATYKKRMALESEQAKLLAEEKELLRQRNAELKNQVREQNAAEGSIEKLRASLVRLNKEYDSLSKSQREASEGKALLTSIQQTDAALKQLEGSTGRFQRNVGNYSGAVNVLKDRFDEVSKQLQQLNASGTANQDVIASLQKEYDLLSNVVNTQQAGFVSMREEIKQNEIAIEQLIRVYGEDDAAVQALIKQNAELRDSFSDLQAKQKALGSDTFVFDGLIQSGQALVGVYSAAQGAAALFGDENEDLQKVMVRLQAAMALVQGVQATVNALQKEGAAIQLVYAVRTALVSAAMKVYTFLTTAATVATTALRTALLASGIGTILLLLPLAVKAMGAFGKETKDTTDSIEDQNKAIKALAEGYDELAAGIDRSTKLQLAQAKAGGATASQQTEIEIKALKEKLSIYEQEKQALIDRNEYTAEASKRVNQLNDEILNTENEIKIKQLEGTEATKKEYEDRVKAQKDAADKLKENNERELKAAFDLRQLYAERIATILKETGDDEQKDYRQRIAFLKLYAEAEKEIIDERVKFETRTLSGNERKLAIERGNNDKLELTKATEKQITSIINDEAEKRQQAAEAQAERDAEFMKSKDDELQKQADAEYDINLDKIKRINAINDANREAEKQKEKELADYKKQVTAELVDFLQTVVNGVFEKQKNQVQEQIDLVEKQKEAEIAAATATATTAQEKADKIASIEAVANAKKEALERQQRKIDADRAKAEKAFSLLRVAIDTAQKLFQIKAQAAVLLANPLTAPYAAVALAQIPFVIASGAIAAAAIAATPIPKYRTGRKGGPAELAITGDGGVKEVIQYTDGTTQLTPDKPTLTYLPQGAKVYKSVTDYIKEYSSFTRIPDVAPGNVQINEMHAHQQTMQMMKMELNDMRNDLKSIEKAITAKPVHQINQTWSGVEVSFEGVAGWTKYTNRYLKT